MEAVAAKLGIGTAETVRSWLRRAEVDASQRPGTTSEEATEIKPLKAEIEVPGGQRLDESDCRRTPERGQSGAASRTQPRCVARGPCAGSRGLRP